MNDFFSINRYALLVRPKPALIDWVNSVFPEDPIDFAEIEKAEHDQTDVFLIPEFESVEDALEWLKESCESFLEIILENWCSDEETWPQNLDWALFERFFDYSIQSEVTDTIDEEE